MPIRFRQQSALALCLLCAPLSTAICQESDVVALGQLLKHPKKEERREAAYELLQLGEASAPVVRQLVGAMKDDDDQVWTRAVMTLGAIGPKASYAIPALIEDMGGNGRYAEQHRQRCSFALSRIGDAAIPSLVKALQDENQHRRWGAVHALALMGSDAANQAPQVLALLADPEPSIRAEVADALHVFGETSIPLLVEKLTPGTDAAEQQAAINALALFGETAASARLPLLSLLDTALPAETHGNALVALVALGLDSELLVPMLIDAVLQDDTTLREHALQAILTLRQPAQSIVPTLAALLIDSNRNTRLLAADTLTRLGTDAASAAHVPMDRLSQGNWDAEETAWLTKSLIAMGPGIVPDLLRRVEGIPLESLAANHWTVQCLKAVSIYDAEAVVNALGDQVPSVRYVALQAFPDLRRRDAAAQARLRMALKDESGALRAAARGALGRAHVPVPIWSMAIDQGINDSDARVRAATLACLQDSPMSNRKRRRVVAELFHDPDPNVRREAILEVGRLGVDAQRLVPDLVAVLEDESTLHIEETLQALATMGPDAASSAPALAAMLERHDKRFHVGALQTLQAIGEAAQVALPAINDHLHDDDAAIKLAAFEAFAKIESDPDKLTPIFIAALQNSQEEFHKPAITGFSRLGKEANGAVEALVKLLDSESTVQVALEALRQIRFRDVDLYLKILEHPESSARSFACERLGRLGNLAERALPLLRTMADDDPDRYVRRQARDALRRIEDRD